MIIKSLLGISVILGVATELFAALPSGWTDDFDAAKATAAAENKNILMVFSGSDWCGWCRKFDRDTLSKSDFIKPASKKFVLVMIDSPKNKSVLSSKARLQNPGLVSRYNVHSYPNVVLTDAEGNLVARSAGYVKGGPKAFLDKLDGMLVKAKEHPEVAVNGGEKRVWKGRCDCGPECWTKLLCKCCRQNNGRCCRKTEAVKREIVKDENKDEDSKRPDDGPGKTSREVACWTVFTEEPELAGKVDEVADFLEEALKAFDEETSKYYRTLKSQYDGIQLHSDESLRGRRDRYVHGKCYLNLYPPESLRTWSWCTFFCGSFLSRCQKEPLPDKERDAMLLCTSAFVAKRMGIDGGDRQLKRFSEQKQGMGRVLYELCSTNSAAISRYYAAKVHLSETGRFGQFLSVSDMAEVFSGVLGMDVFWIFRQYYKQIRKEDVAIRLRGFADEQ